MKKSLETKIINYRKHIETIGADNKKADQLWKTAFKEIQKMDITENQLDTIENIVGGLQYNKNNIIDVLEEYFLLEGIA